MWELLIVFNNLKQKLWPATFSTKEEAEAQGKEFMKERKALNEYLSKAGFDVSSDNVSYKVLEAEG